MFLTKDFLWFVHGMTEIIMTSVCYESAQNDAFMILPESEVYL